ncbi:hemicentin-1-like [Vespula squamosa]|uniref:Hemicentin-1-like n=1 Tax=Vespula squamosa TaxID=30214 RepID=A0ABD2AQC6_VESSQ
MLLGYTLYLQPTFMFNQVDVDLDSLFDIVIDHSMVMIPKEIRRCYGRLFDNAVKLQSASGTDKYTYNIYSVIGIRKYQSLMRSASSGRCNIFHTDSCTPDSLATKDSSSSIRSSISDSSNGNSNGSITPSSSSSSSKARNEIIGPQEKYVRPGSTLQLHCVIKKATVTPSYLFWYHNHRMINYDIEQGIQVNIDLVEHESWLEIQCVSKQHSGNYTCESSNALSARVLVHVIEGDNPAAMQHSTTTCISHRKSIFCVILVLLILSSIGRVQQ